MISLKILNKSDNPDPEYQSSGAAGFDIAVSEDFTIEGASAGLVPTGLHVIIPEGCEGQLRLRSSMWKKHIVMPNAPGTIDSDYRGEIMVPIRNLAPYQSVRFSKGERIAQLVINEIPRVGMVYVQEGYFNSYDTNRGSKGFGSTGQN